MYQHIQPNERDLIAVWVSQGLTVREIAKRLKRSPSSISREVSRNESVKNGVYVAISAQAKADRICQETRKQHPLKDPVIYSYVLERLRRGWSPEEIAGRLKLKKGKTVICHETIYSYIYRKQNKEKRLWEYLVRKQKRRRKQTGRSVQKVQMAQRVSIHSRPKAIDERSEFGHWEGDTVEGRRSEGDGIHTEVERVSRYLEAMKVDRIDSLNGIKAQREIFSSLEDPARRSTTLDNGRENHLHLLLRFLKMSVYFADPYCSCQRGTNENTNGIIRRYLPKGSSFKDLSQEELNDIVWEINHRPKKCLGYNMPYEIFERQLSLLKCCTSN